MSNGDLTEYSCAVCKETKPVHDFQKAQLRGKRTPWCRSCCRDYQLMRKFGLTRQDYDQMLCEQGGGCAICESENPGSKNKGQFSVDHNHETGEVRGLLCTRCNTALGSFKDNPEFLRRAISYLEAATTIVDADHEVQRFASFVPD